MAASIAGCALHASCICMHAWATSRAEHIRRAAPHVGRPVDRRRRTHGPAPRAGRTETDRLGDKQSRAGAVHAQQRSASQHRAGWQGQEVKGRGGGGGGGGSMRCGRVRPAATEGSDVRVRGNRHGVSCTPRVRARAHRSAATTTTGMGVVVTRSAPRGGAGWHGAHASAPRDAGARGVARRMARAPRPPSRFAVLATACARSSLEPPFAHAKPRARPRLAGWWIAFSVSVTCCCCCCLSASSCVARTVRP